VEVAAGGGGGRGADLGFPAAAGDEVDDALPGLEGPGDTQEYGGLGEDGVLSWRTGMKRFDVRGLSQETYCVLVSAHFSDRTVASRLGTVPRLVHSAESNRPAKTESRSTSVAFRPCRAPARRACDSMQ
jgi:hypothetical protein